jgi:feruloyl esterase
MSKVDAFVKAQCDEADGVKDGLVQNPAACDFRPERDLPRCDGKADGQCFTQAQIETIGALLTAVTDEHGAVVQPGFSVSELQAPMRMPTRPADLADPEPWPNSDRMPGVMWGLTDATLKIFVHRNDPNFHTRSLFSFGEGGKGPVTGYRAIVPKAEVDRAQSVTRMGIGANPEALAKLIRQNRKLLIWHNLSDEKLTPYMSFNYYKQLAKMYGGYPKLQNSVRLFAIPGSGHCQHGRRRPEQLRRLDHDGRLGREGAGAR